MAFSDLQPNQMVDENNASTGGFTAIGTKNAPTECYTKIQALTAYNLNAGNMSDYQDNQLVPKSAWATAVIPIDTTPPAPFDIYGGIQYTDKIIFTWQLTTDNVGVAGYRVYKNNVIQTTVANNINSYTDTPLPSGQTFEYYVQAFDSAGNTRNTIITHLSTLPDSTPPNAFTLTAGVSTETSNSMTWNLAGDNVGVAHYYIIRDDLVLEMLAGDVSSYIDTPIPSATLYAYKVQAVDAVGNATNSNTIQMVTQSVGAGIPISISSGSTESTSICGRTASGTIYATSNNIVAGMIMYTDSHLTTPFNGGSRWYRNLNNNTRMFIQSSGSVGQPVSCP